MLRELRIKNLVLVDFEEMAFHEGYNVISGETGSGKSAILQALDLIGGGKFEHDLLRHGESFGWVEALFAVNEEMSRLLAEAGLLEAECLIRRELRIENGSKRISRAYVNNRLASTEFLKALLATSFEVLSQKAPFLLHDRLYQQKIFDEFAGVDLSRFQKSFHEMRGIDEKRRHREAELQKLSREKEFILFELKEIDDCKMAEGEDSLLFEEYSRLVTLGEQQEILSELEGNFQLDPLHQGRRDFQTLSKLAPALESLLSQYAEHLSGLRAILNELHRYRESLTLDPDRLHKVSLRLEQIEKLKKKHGGSFSSILDAKKRLSRRIQEIDESILQYDSLDDAYQTASLKTHKEAALLSQKRADATNELKQLIEKSLRELNMAHAEFEARLIPSPRSTFGDERVEFHVRTNRRDKWLLIAESGSGGELARLLLAFRLALAKKKGISTLLFDEIDAHIGGETAHLVGKKLAELAAFYQVIVVTHFPQVALHAHHHIQVKKVEEETGTFTKISPLTGSSREKELERMAGIL